ncbi:MAG: penicillin-binding protein 2, partial [Planctomycetaceae bacterium]|nr:penicillin-binding protein 2 [Planctomycetaceae bacterium]
GSIPMGHELAVTPLQMIAAHAVLANGGRKISPHLLMMTDSREPEARQVVVSRVVREEVADWVVREPMAAVVQRGTGKQARLEGITVFGKTGTAQKTDPENGGYVSDRHISSFVCGAPAENPRLLVLVMVDEPQGQQYGGSVAAPTAARILKRGLDLEHFLSLAGSH